MDIENKTQKINHLIKPEIDQLIKEKDWHTLKNVLINLPSMQIAELIQCLEINNALVVFLFLPLSLQSEVFSNFERSFQLDFLKEMKYSQIAPLLSGMNPDDRVALFEGLPSNLLQKLLNLLSPQDRKETLTLLGYPENSVGRLMTPDYVKVQANWTIEKALNHIRKFGKDAETINMVYVVDENGRLIDDIPLRKIIIAEPQQRIESLLERHFIAVEATEDQEKAAKLIEKYDLIALPVIDKEGVLLGIVTIDDIIDIVEEEDTEDFTKIAGIESEPVGIELITKLREIPLHKIYRSRITWLVVLLVMDIITGGILQSFKEVIARYVVLVTFLPVLVDTAGNAGAQSATLVIRSMAVGEVKLKDWIYILGKEILVATSLALTMALGISFMGFLRGGKEIAFVVVLAMLVNVVVGCLVGVLLPFIFTKFKKDPASASTPLITTLSDIFGTAIYMGLACSLLR